MIFVTVGSREYQFDRLIREIDRLVEKGVLKEEVFAQIGESEYTPVHYKYKKFLSPKEFENYQNEASLIITHGGTGAIVSALKKKKQVIAVPRLSKYNEHTDDHQLQVVNELYDGGYLHKVLEIKDLANSIQYAKKNSIEKKFNKESNIRNIINSFLEEN